jgi:hypothetical protein
VLRNVDDTKIYFIEQHDSDPKIHQNYRPFTNVSVELYPITQIAYPVARHHLLKRKLAELAKNHPDMSANVCKSVTVMDQPASFLRWVEGVVEPNPKTKHDYDRVFSVTEDNPCYPNSTHKLSISYRANSNQMRFAVGSKVRAQLVVTKPFDSNKRAQGIMYSSVAALSFSEKVVNSDPELKSRMRAIVPDTLLEDIVPEKGHNIFIGGFTGNGPTSSTSNTFDFLDCEKTFMRAKYLREAPLKNILQTLSSRALDNVKNAEDTLKLRKEQEKNPDPNSPSSHISTETLQADVDTARRLLKAFPSTDHVPTDCKKIRVFINLMPWLSNYGRNPNGRFNEADVHQWISTFRRFGVMSDRIFEIINITPTHNYTDKSNFNLSHSLLQHLTQFNYPSYLRKVEVVSNMLHLGATHQLTNELEFGMSHWLARICLFIYTTEPGSNPCDFTEEGHSWPHEVVDRDIQSLQLDVDDSASSKSVVDRELSGREVLLTYSTGTKGIYRRIETHLEPYRAYAYPCKVQIPYSKRLVVELPTEEQASRVVESNKISQTGFVSAMLRRDFHGSEGFLFHFQKRCCVPSLIAKIAPNSPCAPAGPRSFKVIPHPDDSLTIDSILSKMKAFNTTCSAAGKSPPFLGVEDGNRVHLIRDERTKHRGWLHGKSHSSFASSPPPIAKHASTIVIGADVGPNQRQPIIDGLITLLNADQRSPRTTLLGALLVLDPYGYRSFALKLSCHIVAGKFADLPDYVKSMLATVGLPKNTLIKVRTEEEFPIDGPEIAITSGKMSATELEIPKNDFFVSPEHAQYLELAAQTPELQSDVAEVPGPRGIISPNIASPPPESKKYTPRRMRWPPTRMTSRTWQSCLTTRRAPFPPQLRTKKKELIFPASDPETPYPRRKPSRLLESNIPKLLPHKKRNQTPKATRKMARKIKEKAPESPQGRPPLNRLLGQSPPLQLH